MPDDTERKMISTEELAVALAELELAGLIEYKQGSDEDFNLTDKGWDYAWNIWFGMPGKERLVLWLLTDYIADYNEARKRGDVEDP